MIGRYLIVFLLVAAAVRIALVAAGWNRPERLTTPDSVDYVTLARSLAERGTFDRDGRPEIFRSPGYPFFLVVGEAFGRGGWRVALVVQVLLDVLLVYVAYLLGCLVSSPRVGLWAAAFQAFGALPIAASCRLLSDAPYALLLTLALCLTIHHLRTGRTWSVLAAGGMLAAASYVRPVGLVMALVFAVVLLTRRRGWLRAGALVGVVALAAAPWIVRNYAVARYVGFSSFATDAMYYFAVPELRSRLEERPASELRRELRRQAQPALQDAEGSDLPGPAAHDRARQAVRVILEHPGTYAGVHLRGSLGFWLPGAPELLEVAGLTVGQRGTHDVLRREGLWAAARHYFGGNFAAMLIAGVMTLLLGAHCLAVAMCLVRGALRHVPAEAWLMLAMVAVSMLLTGPFGLPRYRAPVAPVLNVAAGAGVVAALDWFRRRRAGRTGSDLLARAGR